MLYGSYIRWKAMLRRVSHGGGPQVFVRRQIRTGAVVDAR